MKYFFRYKDKPNTYAGMGREDGGYPYPTNDLQQINFWTDYEAFKHYHQMFPELEACQGTLNLTYGLSCTCINAHDTNICAIHGRS